MRILKCTIHRIIVVVETQEAEHFPVLRIELLDEENIALKSVVAEIHWYREEYNVEMCDSEKSRSRFVNELVGKKILKCQTKLAFAEPFAVVGPFPGTGSVSVEDVAH
jgi:hypothetical protein